MDSKGRRDPLDPQEIKATVGVKALLDRHQAHPGDQADYQGLVDQGVQLLWMRHPTPHPMIKDDPMIHHHRFLLR